MLPWFTLAVAVAMYVLVVAFPQRKAAFTLAAAALAIVAGAVPLSDALTTYVNWNVLMIYVGSLAIAELFIYSRVPARVADEIVDRSPNATVAVVAILVMTGLISAFVENVATVLVMAPIAFALSNKLGMKPTYFLVGLAVMANLQGTATLVGDPPSMIFASFADYGFNDFFVFEGRPSIFFAVQIGSIVGALFFYRFFAKAGKQSLDLERLPIVSWVPTALLVLMVAGLAAASFLHAGVSLLSGSIVMGLGLAGLAWYRFVRQESGQAVWKLVKGLDWDTILFLVGIFVVVGALSAVGLLERFSAFLGEAVGGNVLLGFVAIVVISTLISGFVDNVPYIIIMLPVAAELSSGLGLKPELYMFGLLIGSCMGGNLTPFGASANVVAVGMLKKRGFPTAFADWLKIGLPFTLLTTAASAAFVWLVWR
jgi:Na+/H+ antiporter NhaD/arsenite permease-like protein